MNFMGNPLPVHPFVYIWNLCLFLCICLTLFLLMSVIYRCLLLSHSHHQTFTNLILCYMIMYESCQNLRSIYDFRLGHFNRWYHGVRNIFGTNRRIKHLGSIVPTSTMHDRNEPSQCPIFVLFGLYPICITDHFNL